MIIRKKLKMKTIISVVLSFALVGVSVFAEDDGGCWRPTYGRGVGVPISVCADGLEKQAGLCYTPCESGYYGVGPVCWHSCPEGFTDYGVGCSKPAPYGRTAGFITKSWCEGYYPAGCEMWGLLWYPICKDGYYNFMCCVCTSYCPEGLIDTGASCTKSTYGRGVGSPLTCAKNVPVYDAGLCYVACEGNYNGVGPICWDTCPDEKYGCGALCLDSKEECVSEMFSIAQEVAIAVAEIATDPADAPSVLAETVAKLAPDLAKPFCQVV